MSIQLTIRPDTVKFVYDKKHLRQVLRAAANEVKGLARNLIRSSPAGGRKYGKRIASSPGEAPRSRSGKLARSLKVIVFKSGEGAAIRAPAESVSQGGGQGMPYARALEGGAARYGSGRRPKGIKHRKRIGAPGTGYRQEPRPFLSTALLRISPSLEPRIATALRDDVKLVRVKP